MSLLLHAHIETRRQLRETEQHLQHLHAALLLFVSQYEQDSGERSWGFLLQQVAAAAAAAAATSLALQLQQFRCCSNEDAAVYLGAAAAAAARGLAAASV